MNKLPALICLLLLALSCKKPFTPVLNQSGGSGYLVIEGFISGNDSTFIRLSRSKKVDTSHTVTAEAGAQVSIESNAGGSYLMSEKSGGFYAIGPLNLDNAHTYRLRIKTVNGKEYLSDYVPLKNSPPIDSVGFTAQGSGVQIYVNSHDDNKSTRYYRWDYTEGWQFHTKYNSSVYSNGVDSLKSRAVDQQIYSCFGADTSSTIAIVSTTKLTNDIVSLAPITLIPGTSEKLETKYSIAVRQYALTSDAYEFWEDLQKNTEKLGSIFDVLPSELQSNFHCTTNPNELVIGYLSAGNVSIKRIFITASQLPSYSTQYPYDCELDTAFMNPPHPGTLPINDLVPLTSPYMPVTALYLPPANPFGLPTAYTYSARLCVDCTLRGRRNPPPYWR